MSDELSGDVEVEISVAEDDLNRLEEEGTVRYHAKALVTVNSEQMELGTWIYIHDAVDAIHDIPAFRTTLLDYLRSPHLKPKLADGNNEAVAGIYPRFIDRVRHLIAHLEVLRQVLNQHRNLCEDWTHIEPVRIQQIGVTVTNLELEPHADPVAVLAGIFFALQQFIEPQLRPQSLVTLLAAGKTPPDIFQGEQRDPESGFILEEALQGLERGNNIYTSDLVRLMMAVPGVFALSGLSLRAFVDRLEINRDVRNCMRLLDPDDFYPRLSVDDCDIRLFRQGVPVQLDRAAVNARLQQLRDDFQAGFPDHSATDLPVPQGQAVDIETYYSIQNEFPPTYRLRHGEITADMPAQRKAQAKQLKSYLLLFEQLLANYCSQLAHVPDLFSISKQTEQTYHHQPLYTVPAVQSLLKAFDDEQQDGPLRWEAFMRNCNAYIKALNFASEDQKAFRKRRARFIEHLMNRFGESAGDYAVWVRVNNGGEVSSDLIIDQLDFLQDLPVLSARRALAFDYTAEVFDQVDWNTEVSGLEKRVARLLGMPDWRRRTLSKVFDISKYRQDYDVIDTGGDDGSDGGRIGRFRIWNAPVEEVTAGGTITSLEEVDDSKYKILLSSIRQYRLDDSQELQDFMNVARQGRYYVVAQTESTRDEDCRYVINLLDDRFDTNDPIAEIVGNPANRGEAEQMIRDAIHLVQGRSAEGMHLIEHVLLRPLEGSREALAPVQFDLGNGHRETFVEDPYSFQVSVFLPGWAPRFQDPEFRVIVERTIRQEMPAHILPWIYWAELDADTQQVPRAFTDFENAYLRWLFAINGDRHAAAQDTFIQAFNALVQSDHVTLTNQAAYKPFDIER